MVRRALVRWMTLLPQNSLSRAVGWLAQRRRPRPVVALATRLAPPVLGIDLSEALAPRGGFASLDQLFTRQLRPGCRAIDGREDAVVCPVDGRMGAAGALDETTAIQAKGVRYDVARLLDSAADAAAFAGGVFATFYLSPRDYHRIHAPVAGAVERAVAIPGGLLPVFPLATEVHPELFVRNERVVTYLRHARAGLLAVVKVGATAVGRITVSYDQRLASNSARGVRREQRYARPRRLAKGAELGTFHLGSTVVLLAGPGALRLDVPAPGAPVRLGQAIGWLQDGR